MTEVDGFVYIEEWRPIYDFPGYKVSSFGRIKSLARRGCKSNRILSQTYVGSRREYLGVSLKKSNKHYKKRVHLAVCEAFYSNLDNKKTINHKNGIKTDNFFLNLEWSTHSENNRHAFETGIKKRKISREMIDKINAISHKKPRHIASELGIPIKTVYYYRNHW